MPLIRMMVNLISCIICLALLSLSVLLSSLYLSYDIHSNYNALAFKPTPTNKNNTAVSEHPVPINHPPVVKVGPNQTVNENATVRLNGIAIDPDPSDKLVYSWTQLAGPAVKLNGTDTTNPTFTAPKVSSDTALQFSLTAKDDKGAASNSAIVTITVKHANHSPIANAGQDQAVNAGYVVSLDGSGSKDPDGDPLIYSWTQTSGPTVKLDGANSANTPIATFTAPSNISANTTLGFRLTVEDSENASSVDDVKVIDKYVPPPNQPPVANAGQDKTVNAGDSVTLDGSGSRDPDGSIVSYSWKQTAGPPITLNGADTMTASFTALTLSNDSTLKFSLTVKDDKGATSSNPATVMVTVKAAPVPPPITPPIVNQTNTTNATSSTTPAGNMTSATSSNQTNISLANNYQFIGKWGSKGSDIGQFHVIYGIAVDSSGNVYVADLGNDRIQKFDSNGKFITKWGSKGSGDGQFGGVFGGIAVDSSGNVYVTDFVNSRIQKFDSNGKFITKWGSKGSGDGQFHNLTYGIAVDSSGNVYIVDNGNSRIQKFDSNGKFITKWGSFGSGDGQFYGPRGIAVDSSGNVYVTEDGNSRIQKFDSNGKFITKWGSKGSGDGQFHRPSDIAVDPSGNVYVVDSGNNRIQVFAPYTTNNTTSK